MLKKAIIIFNDVFKFLSFFKILVVFLGYSLFLGCASKKTHIVISANEIIKITENVANNIVEYKLKETINNNDSRAFEANPTDSLSWSNSILYSGVFQLGEVSNYPKYINWLIKKGESNDCELYEQPNQTADYSVSQFYLSIFEKPHLNRRKIVIPTEQNIAAILKNPQDENNLWKTSEALSQKLDVIAKLAKIKKDSSDIYLGYLDAQYKKAYASLWDKEHKLFYRDSSYFEKKEKNGNKLFSSPSNGAIFFGLARLISDLPNDWEKKSFYKDVFKQMAQSIKQVQRKDGAWSIGLLGDENEYNDIELSGTSFFIFGIAWGVNNGLLDRATYEPMLLKAWNKIKNQGSETGVFNLYKKPVEFKDYTSGFDVGAFLAAGSEMYKYANTFYPISKNTRFTTFMEDGGWCWYQDPRVVISNKKLLISGVSGQTGDVRLGVFDLQKETLDSVLVLDQHVGIDDHDVPALYKRNDKSVLAVWAKHAREKKHYMRLSAPNDYLKWQETDTFVHQYEAKMGVTYTNLFYLKNQKKLYNFFRDGLNFNPSFITSKDNGETWENRTHFISNEVKGFQRPYAKYLQIDENTVGVSYTDAHPRRYGNNLYYVEFSNNNFYTVDGTYIKKLENGPLMATSGEKLYTGSNTKEKPVVNESVPNSAWTCAMAKDKNNHPYIGYTLYLNDDDLRFRVASWDGKKWHDREIAYAGKCLYKIESSYTGLLAFDPEDPSNVYISTDVNPSTGEDLGGNHEIYTAKINYQDDISTIKWKALTSHSPYRNIRPIVVADEGYKVLLWLYGPWYSFVNYDANVVGIILEKPE